MTKSQKYKRTYAAVLLRIAAADLTTLEIIYRAKGGRLEAARSTLEFCQQRIKV